MKHEILILDTSTVGSPPEYMAACNCGWSHGIHDTTNAALFAGERHQHENRDEREPG